MTERLIRQRGVTSIFVVIFAALLFSILTISFVSLMAKDQRRASDDELSQSAYDSALAGVEDAKRVIMAARSSGGAADQARQAIEDGQCDTIQRAGFAPPGSTAEVLIKSSTQPDSGEQLNQAYTCVKITLDSEDYIVDLEPMRSEIVPLRAKGSFNKVILEWHQPTDEALTGPCGQALVDANPRLLCPEADWTGVGGETTTPALLRAQVITPEPPLSNLDDLNEDDASQTVFLYPSSAGASSVDLGGMSRFYDDYTSGGALNQARLAVCEENANPDEELSAVGGFSCKIELELARSVSADNRLAILRLTSIYVGTKVRVTLYNSSDQRVDFNGVQPTVDSTGRANDLFRRVEARLSLAADIQLPEAAIDMEYPLCKDFFVTDTNADWFDGVHCDPFTP